MKCVTFTSIPRNITLPCIEFPTMTHCYQMERLTTYSQLVDDSWRLHLCLSILMNMMKLMVHHLKAYIIRCHIFPMLNLQGHVLLKECDDSSLETRPPDSHSSASSRAPLWFQELGTGIGLSFEEESDILWDSTCASFESIKGLGVERPGRSYLQLFCLMCGLRTNNTWELVINADSQVPPWTYGIRICFSTRSPGNLHARSSLKSKVRKTHIWKFSARSYIIKAQEIQYT